MKTKYFIFRAVLSEWYSLDGITAGSSELCRALYRINLDQWSKYTSWTLIQVYCCFTFLVAYFYHWNLFLDYSHIRCILRRYTPTKIYSLLGCSSTALSVNTSEWISDLYRTSVLINLFHRPLTAYGRYRDALAMINLIKKLLWDISLSIQGTFQTVIARWTRGQFVLRSQKFSCLMSLTCFS